jgi:hypothetical protein
MTEELERILDACIDLMGRGASLERCLGEYPERGAELEPLLRAVVQTREAFTFTPSVDAKRAARLRFHAALDKKR